MDISALTNVSSNYIADAVSRFQSQSVPEEDEKEKSFSSVLGTAMNLVNETNDYQNQAEEAEIKFALGESTSTHELSVAQEKANVALQYTVAVRDRAIEAYNQIMNMQI